MTKQQMERSARKTRAVLAEHVRQLADHTRAVANYGGHGNAVGKQGRSGHTMPQTNPNLQSGAARLPQRVDGEGCAADDASTRNYGIVDVGGG